MLTSQLGPATCQVLESHTWQMASVSDAAHLSLSSDPQRHLWTQKKKKSVPDITTLESYAAAAKKTTHSLPNAGISHSGKAPELVCHSVVNMYKNILCTPACKSTALGEKNQMFIIRRTDPQNTAQIQARIFNIFAKERTWAPWNNRDETHKHAVELLSWWGQGRRSQTWYYLYNT